MAGLENYDCEGTLTIDGFSMNRAAWTVQSDEDGNGGLMQVAIYREKRGEDRILAGAAGVIAYPRRLTVTRYDFRLVIVGDVDDAGVGVANAIAGLWDNLRTINGNIFDPGGDNADGTRTFLFTWAGGRQMTGDGHVLAIIPQQVYLDTKKSVMVATLQTSFPYGIEEVP